MFEELTAFLPKLQDKNYGEWIVDKENDGTPEHPIQFPFVAYNRIVEDFMDAAYAFIDAHKEMELTRYHDILSESNIEWDSESMKNADVASLDGRTICCAQARWDEEGRLAEAIPDMLALLHDEKPTVVRQCLGALREVILYRPELHEVIKSEVEKLDVAKYKDSMSPLIKKDAYELLKMML